MYPLEIVLAGRHESVMAPIRQELLAIPAHIAAEFPSLPSILQGGFQSSSQDRPRLFVLGLHSADDFQYMRRVRESFVGQPILAIVDSADDPIGILAAMRSGAAQVVPLPLERDDFHAALDVIALMFGFASTNTTVVAVSGVTGGCGATMIATNFAYEIAMTRHIKTVLMELSLQMGMVATYLDVAPRYTTYDLLINMSKVDLDYVQQTLTPVNEFLDILPGPQQLMAPRDIAARDVLLLLDFAKRLCGIVVVDLPCTYNDLFFETLAVADHVVLVAEQKLPSIRALKVLFDELGRDPRIGTENIQRHLVINRYTHKNSQFSVANLQNTLGIEGLKTIANDHIAVTESINLGRPLRLVAPKSKPLEDIRELITEMFAASPPMVNAKPATGSLFGRLGRAMGLSRQ